MIRDLLNKASHSAKAARALLEGDAPDDAVSRVYCSAFNTARALIASKEPDACRRQTHGPTLSAFEDAKIREKTSVSGVVEELLQGMAGRDLPPEEAVTIGFGPLIPPFLVAGQVFMFLNNHGRDGRTYDAISHGCARSA
jgi:hypothetical protein